jgi:hypothetical protein
MALFRSRKPVAEVTPVELVVPRATIDGWTLDGSPLAGKLPRPDLRELATLLHGIAIRVDTPYTYLRAVELLDAAGEPAQAYAVCEAWLKTSASSRSEHTHDTRQLTRSRERLRARLATPAEAG